jgi:hypothetical protein
VDRRRSSTASGSSGAWANSKGSPTAGDSGGFATETGEIYLSSIQCGWLHQSEPRALPNPGLSKLHAVNVVLGSEQLEQPDRDGLSKDDVRARVGRTAFVE